MFFGSPEKYLVPVFERVSTVKVADWKSHEGDTIVIEERESEFASSISQH